MKTPTAIPRWTSSRFSVRGLIAFALVAGISFGLIVSSAKNQREAVAAIRGVGGTVKYDWEWRDNRTLPNGRPWATTRLVDRLGVDYFGNVVYVDLYEAGSDDELVQVGRLGRIQILNLGLSRVTDAGLIHLEGLTHLRVLSLISTEVGDAGLAHLARLTKLNDLRIDDTRVSDAGLARLAGMNELQSLGLGGTAVKDAGLVHIRCLDSLRTLNLFDTRVTDAGMRNLQELLPKVRIVHGSAHTPE